jgi:hypothetical protein
MCSYLIGTVFDLRCRIHAVTCRRPRTKANETEIEMTYHCPVTSRALILGHRVLPQDSVRTFGTRFRRSLDSAYYGVYRRP